MHLPTEPPTPVVMQPYPGDCGYDEIRILDPDGRVLLRLVPYEVLRYWLQWTTSLALDGSLEPCREDKLRTVMGPFKSMGEACAALFPGIFSSSKSVQDLPVASVDYYWKGERVTVMNDPGGAQTLLAVAGHLPQNHLVMKARGLSDKCRARLASVCCWPGCKGSIAATRPAHGGLWGFCGQHAQAGGALVARPPS